MKKFLVPLLILLGGLTTRAENPEINSTTNENQIKTDMLTTSEEPVPLKDRAPSLSAKFGSGFTITTANKSFSIKMNGRMQSLVEVEHIYNSDEKADFAAKVRRARFKISGYVAKPMKDEDDKVPSKYKMGYNIQLGLTNRDISGIASGKGVLLDAYLTYEPCEHLEFSFGQAKLPGNREYLVSSQKQEFVARSFPSTFTLNRDFGLQIKGNFGKCKEGEGGECTDKGFYFRPTLSVATGEGRNLTGLNTGGLDYAVRFDFLPLGKFHNDKGDYELADVNREKKPKLALGSSYDFNNNAGTTLGQNGGSTVADTALSNIHTVTADALFKYKGLCIFGEYARRTVDMDARGTYTTGNAVTASIGYNTSHNTEMAFRYSRISPLDNLDLPKDMRSGTNAYTIALSQYFLGHNLKIQTDYTILDLANSSELSGLWAFQVEVAF